MKRNNCGGQTGGASSGMQLQIPDESTLSRLVAARLDLPVSQSLLEKYKLSIVKRCWEDQLRLKRMSTSYFSSHDVTDLEHCLP